MSEDRIYTALLEISEKLGAVQSSQEGTEKRMDSICKRLDSLEQKPAKRLEGGVMAAISSIIGAIVGAVAAFFFKH